MGRSSVDNPGGKAWAAVAAASLLVYALLCLFPFAEETWRPEWDSAVYILTGRALAAGEGYSYLGVPFTLRPPGLPAFIALVEGTRPFDPAALNRMIQLFAALAVMAVYFAFRAEHGRPTALAAALLTGTSPIVVSRFNWVQSEFPFLAALYAGFGLLALAHRARRGGNLLALLAGAAFAASVYFRTTGIVAAPVLLAVAARPGPGGRRRLFLIAAAAAILLSLPWFLHTARVLPTLEVPPDQLLLRNYGTALLRADPGDPASPPVTAADWGARIRSNGQALAGDLGEGLFGGGGGRGGAFAVAGAAAAGVLLHGGPVSRAAGGFGAAYLLVLLGYFTYATRLTTPLIPVLYLFGLAALARAGGWASGRLPIPRGGILLPAGAALLLLGLNVARMPERLEKPMVVVGGREVRADLMWRESDAVARWIRENTPSDAKILCFRAPIYGVLTGRTAYTYRFPRGRNLVEKYRPDFVLFDMPSPENRERESRVAAEAIERSLIPSPSTGRSLTAYRLTGDPPPPADPGGSRTIAGASE